MSIKPIKPLSADAENPVSTETQAPVPLSTDQLLALIVTLQQQTAQAQKEASAANQALAAAIIKTTEPREYVKSQKEIAEDANNKLFDERAKELAKRQKETQKAEQDSCDHIAGGSPLSEQRDIAGRTSIIWHRNDVNVDVGICTVCQRIFRPGQSDYASWRKKPSFNKLSASGYRSVLDPVRAREESYLHDN
jgi:vancomycin resistance protein YoaR